MVNADTTREPLTFCDFFAGSGLVTEGMRGLFAAVWANDICEKKAAVYCANHGADHFVTASIHEVRGRVLPGADLAWASFPCQDLSLAGPQHGLHGERSGLVWEWLRVIGEMPVKPPVLVAENVVGLVASDGGQQYRRLHRALSELGYKSGALVLDAVHWVPQSRPRVFVVSVPREFDESPHCSPGSDWAHPASLQKASKDLKDWVKWRVPEPRKRRLSLRDILEHDAPLHDEATSRHNLSLISPLHQTRLLQELANGFVVAPGYKRTRNQRQVLELRFDDVSGCLRTPEGGSSRQVLVINRDGQLRTRLPTIHETARLMGVRRSYRIPGSYNDAYRAMGDAVAVPVVRHLAKYLLLPLATALRRQLAQH
jgi:DNA (cytosine-5)-methyltransferase 1